MAHKEYETSRREHSFSEEGKIHEDGLMVKVVGEEPEAHHSHHHHSHHHSRHRKSRKHSGSQRKSNQRKKSFRQIMKKNRKAFLIIFVALLLFAGMVYIGAHLDSIVGEEESEKKTESTDVVEGNLLVSVPVFDGEVSLIGTAAQAYFQAGDDVVVHDVYERYQGESKRLDTGAPVTLSYEIKGAPKGYTVKNATYTVTDEEGKITTIEKAKETQADFFNLKTGTRYTFQINITFANGTVSTVGGEFRTAIGPRMMTVDGVWNMRDVGGWTTTDGRLVRQGLLYRGSELDGGVERKFLITTNGIDVMLKDLGIKTEMDLRPSTENPYDRDMLGSGVKHAHYGAPMYGDVFSSSDSRKTMRNIFSDLANPKQYPAYLHCTYGSDRTGIVCFLLGAVLGVDEKSLLEDYELSALCHGYVSGAEMDTFVERVNSLPGATLKEKVEGYLLDIGVSKKEISSIRKIFLG